MADPPLLPDDRNPHPQIKQDLKGDRNQAIGQAIDSTIVNFAGDGQVINLTINDRISTASLPPLNIVVQNLTQQEYRQRQVLLNKVRDAWVKGVLEKSLHARVSIELGLQERPDLVQQPFGEVAEFAAVPGQALPDGTPATTVFDRLGSGRTLLIVGEPGSGKTIALLKLAEDAIDRTEPDLRQQIPVVFNLSSWARKPQSIEQWLIQELLEKYQVSRALGKTWVESEALMLLLDGLDEVKAEQRNACSQALNQFMQTHGTTEIVICCRIGDYQMLQDRLILRSAICLQPLTAAQIDLYFEQAGDRLSALKAVLPQDAELQELAKSPLMLSVMSLAYQDFTPEQLTVGGKIEDYRKRLFATYIDRMFQRRGTTQQYTREDSQRWLIWLAQKMTVTTQTMFLIERLQPTWLKQKQKLYYRLITDPLSLLFGFESLDEEIELVETLTWSWSEARKMSVETIKLQLFVVLYMPLMGLIIDLLFELLDLPRHGKFLDGLFLFFMGGLIVGVIMMLFFVLLGGLRYSELRTQAYPNQGIWKSTINCVIAGLVFGMLGGLFFGLTFGLLDAIGSKQTGVMGGLIGCVLFFGILGTLYYGGIACLQHLALRLILYHQGSIPWNYARFLDYATERLFMQKVGGGYIFVHRMLLEHFAEMSIEQKNH
jgi:hypothetical protein